MTPLAGSALAEALPLIALVVLAVAVALYVVLDGFDLGMGILFPFTPHEGERDIMMNSVAPFWDGNETWLVLGGAGLWILFPKAYGLIMPAIYLPVILMLLALVLRGVSFEFRWVAKPRHAVWDWAFSAGSILAALAQGMILGAILQGVKVENGQFAGGSLDWLTPFALLCGVGVVAGHGLLGCGWLMLKVEGPTERLARRLARPLLLVVLACAALVSLWTPYAFAPVAERWFTWPNFALLSPLPLLTAALALAVWKGSVMERGATHGLLHDGAPFAATIGIFLLCLAGLGVSLFPYVVPFALTYREAAAHPSSLAFVLIGVGLLLPVVLGYTALNFWLFRGKLKEGEGYH